MLDVCAIKEEVQNALQCLRSADAARLAAIEAVYREHLRATRKPLRSLRTLLCEYGALAVALASRQKISPLENGLPRRPDALHAREDGLHLVWAQGAHAPDVVFVVSWSELVCRKLEVDASPVPEDGSR
jgi:hypothetical protein